MGDIEATIISNRNVLKKQFIEKMLIFVFRKKKFLPSQLYRDFTLNSIKNLHN